MSNMSIRSIALSVEFNKRKNVAGTWLHGIYVNICAKHINVLYITNKTVYGIHLLCWLSNKTDAG